MNANDPNPQTLADPFAQVQQLLAAGRGADAEALCTRIVAAQPGHVAALNLLSMCALQRGDTTRGKALLEQALQAAPEHPALHKNLALAHATDGRLDDALCLLDRALALKPDFALALLHRGEVLERMERRDQAVRTYHTALEEARRQGLWMRPETIPPALKPLLRRAALAVQEARANWLAERLAPLRRQYGDDVLARVDRCIDTYLGKRRLQYPHPRQRPTFMLFPDIPARNYFTREEFPKLKIIEDATADIQAELAQVLTGTEGFRPFIEVPEGPGSEQWATLNHSPDWNAFFFYRDGIRYDANCRRCPRTAAALDAVDISRVPGHSPEAFFSVLTPGTHIPVHTGVTNTRLVCHLPLIIPENCGIRVGGEERGWTEGECLIFDDTFEHEAWNGSDRTRVVLIFDLWNVYLTAAEREAVTVAVEAIGHFNRHMATQA